MMYNKTSNILSYGNLIGRKWKKIWEQLREEAWKKNIQSSHVRTDKLYYIILKIFKTCKYMLKSVFLAVKCYIYIYYIFSECRGSVE